VASAPSPGAPNGGWRTVTREAATLAHDVRMAVPALGKSAAHSVRRVFVRTEGAALTFLPFDGVHEVPQVAVDAFLEAVFGAAPGETVHALAGTPSCRTAKGSGGEMM